MGSIKAEKILTNVDISLALELAPTPIFLAEWCPTGTVCCDDEAGGGGATVDFMEVKCLNREAIEEELEDAEM